MDQICGKVAKLRSYAEWKVEAETEDQRKRTSQWRADLKSTLYDYRVINHRLEELRDLRAQGRCRCR